MIKGLENIGFSSGEEKVYLSLLELGEASTGKIAKTSGVSRSKVYEVLEKLSRKGLVSHFKKNGRGCFRAAAPSRILEYLEEKKEKIEEQKKEFEKKIPIFESIIGQKEVMKEPELFEGMEGIKNVREEALENMKSGEIMYYFGNASSGHDYVLGYWDDWNKRRVKKKIRAWIVYNQDSKKFGERRKQLPYTKVKYLPVDGKSDAWIEIYRDTVAIVVKKETPMSVVVNNKIVAESFRTYFDVMWKFGLEKLSIKKNN
jgi:sugar-specific transcriptional regulator TrmB